MVQLIFKNDIEQSKLDALLCFLKSWNIDAELKTTTVEVAKKKSAFSLTVGLWQDYDINANELRNRAWSRTK